MAFNNDDFKIPNLNYENYHSWSIRVKAALVHRNCWNAIEPEYNDQMTEGEKKRETITFLFLVVEDAYLDDINDCKTAKEAWNILECIHMKYGLLHTLQLMRDLFNVQLKEDENMKNYLGRIMDLHRKLKRCNYNLQDKELSLIMLLGLPKQYETLILHLEQNEENLNSSDVKSNLLLEEKRRNRRDELDTAPPDASKALLMKDKIIYKRDENRDKFKNGQKLRQRMDTNQVNDRLIYNKNVKCFCCGGFGHIAKNCPSAKIGDRYKTKKIVYKALGANTKKINRNNAWYLDSGATDHMTNCYENFINFIPIKSSVEVANRERLPVLGKGTVEINTLQLNHKIKLNDVLYVPKLDSNLISVGRMEEDDYEIIFKSGKAIIKENNNCSELLTSKRIGNLYKIHASTKLCKKVNEKLWHKRLGHLHSEAVMKLLGETNENIQDDAINIDHQNETEKCEICLKGKIKKFKFPKKVDHRSTEALELVHSDLMGPIKTSKGGSKYVATFIDDYSRYTKVYFLKHKNEVLSKFIEYQREVERQTDKKIKTLRSDNGLEYTNDTFDKYLKTQGIKRQLTVPGNPEQNGVAERMNQTLMNMTRCLLIESEVPHEFWADALHTAAYIRNKCPSTANQNLTPEELWTNKRTKIGHLKVFGCSVWNTVRSQKRFSKLDPKGEENVFMGYSQEAKGYKLWNRTRQRMFVERNVIFNEKIFPYKQDKTTHSSQENLYSDLNFWANNDTDNIEDSMINSETEQPEQNLKLKENTQNNEIELQVRTNRQIPSSNTEVRRSERIAKSKEINIKCNAVNCTEEETTKDPNNLKEAMALQDADKWRQAMEEELKNLEENKTWELVQRPKGKNVLGSKWVFKKKFDTSGKLQKYKARLVAKGFSQLHGIDYEETFAPVVKQKTLRLLIAIAVERGWKAYQMDVKSAYLNGYLEEEVYMERPQKEKHYSDDLVCLLHRSVYGLKQSGRQWNTRLNQFLTEWGLKNSKADPCVYYDNKRKILIGIYVDDLLVVVENDHTYKTFQKAIDKEFGARDLGETKDLLGIKIERKNENEITLSQEQYIQEILKKYKMEEAKLANTPLEPGTKYKKLNKDDTVIDVPYRQAIGSLLYLSGSTRPDLAYATSYMSQFNDRPSKDHWTGIKHICRYLRKTKDLKLTYRKTGEKLAVYADADWGSDSNDHKSYSGYVIVLAGAAISWNSHKQRCTFNGGSRVFSYM